jgi:phage gp45-like
MHRATPVNSSFRSYSAGGARATIPEVDDNKFMQESTNTGGMRGEKIPTMEAPQNYGFTSVVADADKSGNPGSITDSAEGFISFMGGNRSFPVMGVMDDRRHRLMNLAKDAAKGATAMFGLKKWGQQLLNTEDGWFMTGNTEKKMRLQLVENKNGQQQSGGGDGGGGASGASLGVSALADGGGGGGGGGAGGAGGGQQKGQKTLHKEKSETYVDMTKEAVHSKRGNGQHQCQDNHSTAYHKDVNHSCQATAQHSHIKSGVSIWVAGGCFSDMPIIVKKDGMCVKPKEEQQQQSGSSA